MSELTTPAVMVQSNQQWRALHAFSLLGPVRYNQLEELLTVANPALEWEEFNPALSALRERGLVQRACKPDEIGIYYSLSPAGEAALRALPHGLEPLTREQILALLSAPPRMPVDRTEMPEANPYGVDDPSWYQLEDSWENAWELAQAAMARWCADLAARMR